MQDLILDKTFRKELIGIEENTKQLKLKFTEGVLLCYHDQQSCELFVYLGKKSNNLGVVAKTSLRVNKKLYEKSWRSLEKFSKNVDLSSYLQLSNIENESHTVTTLKISFLDGTSNIFKFLGVSNGYYSEKVQFEWINY